MGWSESPVGESVDAGQRGTSPPKMPKTTSEPIAESTGNQARVLSDLRTAHERLAISHEVWNRPIDHQYR